MEKKLTREAFAAALAAAGARLKPEVAADPSRALRKLPSKARERLLAQLGVPGGARVAGSLEGDLVVLRVEAEDRFAGPRPGALPRGGRRAHGRRGKAAGEAGAPKPGKGWAAQARGRREPAAAPEPPTPLALAALAPDGKGPAWKPPLRPTEKEVDLYPVNAPFAWVRLVADEEAHETTYNVLEPPLTEREARILAFLEDTLVDVIEIPLSDLASKEARAVLLDYVNQVMYDYSILLDEESKAKLLYFVERDFLGFGIIDALMRDDLIEDVSCDGPHVPIFLYHRKHESLRSNVQFVHSDSLDAFVIRLAQRSGKHISIAEPLLDATLPDGSRLNATLSHEVTAAGSTFTIRKFRKEPFTPPDLVRFGTMSVDILAYWWLAVQYGASAIYSGGTASGKTTSLNAILLFIPPTMKVVSIEDTRELNLPHPNWIPAVTRSGFGPRDAHGRQAGEIDMFTLLKAALRQRPEYILVGEVRGQEAFNLFQAMATGHTAYGTMHADSVEAVIHRLEGEPLNIPRSLLEALDIVSVQIQTRIGGKRVRRTKELVEVVGLDPHTHEILTNTVFRWNPATDEFEYSGVSYVLERIQAERGWSAQEVREEWERRKDVLRWLIQRDVRDFRQVGRVIAAYYKDPAGVIGYVRQDLAAAVAKPAADAARGAGPGPASPHEALPATLPRVIEDAAAEAEREARERGPEVAQARTALAAEASASPEERARAARGSAEPDAGAEEAAPQERRREAQEP